MAVGVTIPPPLRQKHSDDVKDLLCQFPNREPFALWLSFEDRREVRIPQFCQERQAFDNVEGVGSRWLDFFGSHLHSGEEQIP